MQVQHQQPVDWFHGQLLHNQAGKGGPESYRA